MTKILDNVKAVLLVIFIFIFGLLNGIFELFYRVSETLHGVFIGIYLRIVRLFDEEGQEYYLRMATGFVLNDYQRRSEFQIKIIKKIAGL